MLEYILKLSKETCFDSKFYFSVVQSLNNIGVYDNDIIKQHLKNNYEHLKNNTRYNK